MRSCLALLLAASALPAAEPAKVGDAVPSLGFTDTRSLKRTLNDLGPKAVVVVAFVDTSCPVAQRYLPVLNAMAKAHPAVKFLALDANPADQVIDVALHGVKLDLDIPLGKDFGGACAKALGVTRTPEVAVIDGERTLRYRGRIDDQHRVSGSRAEPTARELKDALDAVLAGKPVEVPTTEADGCPITFSVETKPKAVTYSEHVAPILKAHCWQCHGPGGNGPFELTSYKESAARAAAIREAVEVQRMPPWFTTHDFGPFTNRRELTDAERETIRDWVRGGMAEGDAAKAPAQPKPPANKWAIGEPDRVLSTFEIDLPATGEVPYKYAVLPGLFTDDVWAEGIQILPSNPRVLHHCNMAYAKLTEKFDEANFITGYVPGGEAATCPPGQAIRIPAGCVLVLQMHFVTTGKAEKCTVDVGLRYPRGVVATQLRNHQITDRRFAIPPGAAAHKVARSHTFDRDVVGVGLFSHMHLRGKDMTFTAHPPAGKPETLLVVPNYNFEWQIPYRWVPNTKTFPKGTRIECVARYDNSAFNPFNPDPTATVKFGLQTQHEMMIGYVFYTEAGENLNLRIDPKTGRVAK